MKTLPFLLWLLSVSASAQSIQQQINWLRQNKMNRIDTTGRWAPASAGLSPADRTRFNTMSGAAKGDKGDKGEKGDKGDKGDAGEKGDVGSSGVVTALSPLSYNSGTRTVMIAQAGAGSSGFLSAADWATFSAKANAAHTHALTDLLPSGASVGQIIQWNGSSWVPLTLSSPVSVTQLPGGTLITTGTKKEYYTSSRLTDAAGEVSVNLTTENTASGTPIFTTILSNRCEVTTPVTAATDATTPYFKSLSTDKKTTVHKFYRGNSQVVSLLGVTIISLITAPANVTCTCTVVGF